MMTATQFREALKKAKEADLVHVREAVEEALLLVEEQMEKALANPKYVSNNPCFGAEMPAKAMYNGSYDKFIHLFNTKLALSGWTVEKSHDGGGMYATYVVKMVPETSEKNTKPYPRPKNPHPCLY